MKKIKQPSIETINLDNVELILNEWKDSNKSFYQELLDKADSSLMIFRLILLFMFLLLISQCAKI